MTGYTVHAGSNQKFAAGWDQIFRQGAGGSGSTKKATQAGAPAKPAAATKAGAKKAGAKKGAAQSRAKETPSSVAAPAARMTQGGSKTRKK